MTKKEQVQVDFDKKLRTCIRICAGIIVKVIKHKTDGLIKTIDDTSIPNRPRRYLRKKGR